MTKGSYEDGVVYHAGFPNSAEDQNLGSLSLDSLIVKHRTSTFFWRLDVAVPELHWKSGSLLVVDRALSPKHGSVGVIIADGEHVLARFNKSIPFRLDGSRFDGGVTLWGIVTYCIQALEKEVS